MPLCPWLHVIRYISASLTRIKTGQVKQSILHCQRNTLVHVCMQVWKYACMHVCMYVYTHVQTHAHAGITTSNKKGIDLCWTISVHIRVHHYWENATEREREMEMEIEIEIERERERDSDASFLQFDNCSWFRSRTKDPYRKLSNCKSACWLRIA